MKQALLLITALLISGASIAQTSNVGIGTNNPQTRLQVAGAISSTPVSLAAANNVVIPDNYSIFRLTLTSGGSTTALTLTNPKEGQYLTIYNEDDNAATFAGQTIAATTGVMSFSYINGAWRQVSDNQAGGNNFVKNQTPDNAFGTGQAASMDITNNAEVGSNLNVGGKIGVGTTSPDASSLIDMTSTTKGMLIPRMSTGQRNTITTPATGLMIYNTTTNQFNYYDGVAWQIVGTGAGGPPTGAASGDLSGTYPGPTVANNAITSNKILDGTITSADLATPAVNAANQIFNTLPVGNGGTGQSSLTSNGVVYGNGTSSVGVTSAPSAGNVLIGNASGVPSFAPLGGDVSSISGTGNVTLANSGVTAATYGSSTQVPQVIVDSKGRVTSATNVTISGVAPGGAAGGDLTGSYPNPTINTSAVTSSKIADGTIVDADINAAAGITRSKLATGTANQVVINDGSGNLSSEAQLAISRGGTNATSANYTSGKFLQYDGTRLSSTSYDQNSFAPASSLSGTTNYVPKFTSATAVGNSQVFDNGTSVGVGTSSPGQKLEVNGNLKIGDNLSVEGNSSYRVYRNLGSYANDVSSAVGAFAIVTQQPFQSACMFTVRVKGYFYDATSPFDINIGAYMYTDGNFYNTGYTNIGSNKLSVQLAKNTATNTIAIILGNIGTGYSYPKITVSEFTQSYSSINETYADGWTISQVTSLSGFSNLATVPDVTTIPSGSGSYIQNQTGSAQSAGFNISGNGYVSGNIGIGTTSPSDKLQINGGSIKMAYATNETPYQISSYSNGSSLWFISGSSTQSKLVLGTGFDWDRQASFAYTPGTVGAAGGNLQIGQLDKNNASFTHGITSFYTNGLERARIDNNGNVGIGATSMSVRLKVAGDIEANNQIRATGWLTGTGSGQGLEIGVSGGNSYVLAYDRTNSVYSPTRYVGSTIDLRHSDASSDLFVNTSGYVGIGTQSVPTKLYVAGDAMRTNSRVTNSQSYPMGRTAPDGSIFVIDPTWSNAELQNYFNSSSVQWSNDATAPAGWSIQISGPVNVGGAYNSGFPYIPIETGATYYMECWIKSSSSSVGHYMGSIDYNESFVSLGGNPGSYGYWVMSNTFPGTGWTKVSGTISGFGSTVGTFVSGAKYWTPQALFNYTNGGGAVTYISGWKVIKMQTITSTNNTDGSITYYSPSTKRYHASSRYGTNGGKTISLDMSLISELCGGVGGCKVTGIMRKWTADSQTEGAIRSGYVMTYNSSDKHWRISNTDNSGVIGNGSVEHVLQWWDCYLTDGVYPGSFASGTDPGTNSSFGLLNWNSSYTNANKTCEVVFEAN